MCRYNGSGSAHDIFSALPLGACRRSQELVFAILIGLRAHGACRKHSPAGLALCRGDFSPPAHFRLRRWWLLLLLFEDLGTCHTRWQMYTTRSAAQLHFSHTVIFRFSGAAAVYLWATKRRFRCLPATESLARIRRNVFFSYSFGPHGGVPLQRAAIIELIFPFIS